MFSLRPVVKAALALLIILVPSASVVVAQQQQQDVEKATLVTSDDPTTTDASSLLMTNYNALREEGQGFYLVETFQLFEKPNSVTVPVNLLLWWCDLEFSSEYVDTNKYGYVGRAVSYFLGNSLEEIIAQGAELPQEKKFPFSVSAVLVPTLGIFEGQIHPTFDDLVIRYWDDGNSTLPILGWEGHDEGDTSPNADTSAFSGSGTSTKITTEKAAKYLGMDVAKLTPATCSKQYKEAWNLMRVPDRTNITVATLEGDITQLQADNSQLLLRCCD